MNITELYRISTVDPGWSYIGIYHDPDDHHDEVGIGSDYEAAVFTSKKVAKKELEMLKEYFPDEVKTYGLHVEKIWKT